MSTITEVIQARASELTAIEYDTEPATAEWLCKRWGHSKVPKFGIFDMLCDGIPLYAMLHRHKVDVVVHHIRIPQFTRMGSEFVIRRPTRGQVILMEMLAKTVDVRY